MRCPVCASTIGVRSDDEGTQSYDSFAESVAEAAARVETISDMGQAALPEANQELRAQLAAWRANHDAE